MHLSISGSTVGKLLEVAEVGARVGVDDDAGIEQAGGVGQRLELAHDLIGFRAPLGFDERGHVASGSVLGLERPVEAVDHEFHDIFDEVRILVDGALVVERLGDDEVEIAVLGVAEDDGIVVAVAAEEPVQLLRGGRQVLDGEGNVFDDDRGAALAHRRRPRGTFQRESSRAPPGRAASWVNCAGSKQLEARAWSRLPALRARRARTPAQTGTRPAVRPRLRQAF